MSCSKRQQAALRPKLKETSPKKIRHVPKCPIQLHDVGQPMCRSFDETSTKEGNGVGQSLCHEIEIFAAIDGAEALFPAQPIVWKPGSFACV
jgi:hypothetical protein